VGRRILLLDLGHGDSVSLMAGKYNPTTTTCSIKFRMSLAIEVAGAVFFDGVVWTKSEDRAHHQNRCWCLIQDINSLDI
jgi:hypothetical protein